MRALFILLMVGVMCMAPAYAYTISGDTVTWENNYGKVTQAPYNLTGITTKPIVNFTSKFATTQYLDIAFGFDVPSARPTQALWYNPRVVTYNHSYTCDYSFNYTANHFWCYRAQNGTQQVIFEHDYESGSVATKTAYWTTTDTRTWTDISDKFNAFDFEWQGMNRWYVIENVEFAPGETKTIQISVDALPGTSGKYDIFIKRSADTFNWVLQSGEYVLLDPWWNAAWSKCRNLTYSGLDANGDYAGAWIEKNITGLTFSSTNEIRIVDQLCNAGGSEVDRDIISSGTGWALVGFYHTGAAAYSVYYDNPAAGGLSTASVFDVETTTKIDTTKTGAVNEYITQSISGAGFLGNWNLTNATGTTMDRGIGTENYFAFYDSGGLATVAAPTRGEIFKGNLTYWVWQNSSTDGYYFKIKYFKNKIRLEVDAASTAALMSFNTYQLTGGTVYAAMNNSSNVIVTHTGASVINPTRGENWTASYGDANQYVMGHWLLDSGTGGCALDRFYSSGSYVPLTGIGSDASPTCYPIDDNDVVEWRILSYDSGGTGSAKYTVPVREAYLAAVTPISLTVGAEQSDSSANATWARLYVNGTEGNLNTGYGNATNLTATINVTGFWVAILRNGTLMANGTNSATWTGLLPAGTWNITAYGQSNATLSQNSTSRTVNLTKSVPSLALANNASWSTVYGNATTTTGSGCPSQLTCSLYRNGTAKSNPETVKLGAGNHIYVYNTSGGDNYTSATATQTLAVSQAATPWAWTVNGAAVNSSAFPYGTNIVVNISLGIDNYCAAGCMQGWARNSTQAYYLATAVWNFSVYNNTSTAFGYNGLPLDTYYFKGNWTGNANYTAQDLVLSFILSPTGLMLITLDEQTNASVTFNVSMSNDTFSSTSYNQTTFVSNATNTPYGTDVLVTVWADGYPQRSYYMTLANTSNETLTAYLLASSSGQWVNIYTKTTQDQPVSESAIDALTITADGWKTIAQGITDDSGNYPFFLNPSTPYLFVVNATGYAQRNVSIIPTLTTYVIRLLAGYVTVPDYWTYYYTTNSSCAFDNTSRVLNCTWSGANLTNVSLGVVKMNATSSYEICANTSANTTGWLQCGFGSYANQTFIWTLDGTFGTHGITLASGTWTEGSTAAAVLGGIGIIAAMLIVIFCGFVGVQLGSPIGVVVMTTIGVAASWLIGFLDLGTAGLMFLMGLGISGAVLVYKMRSG